MKKRSIFLLVLVALISLFALSVNKVSAATDYEFAATSGANGENNSFVMTGTRANIEADITGSVTETVYVSIMYKASTGFENFDVYLNGTNDSGETLEKHFYAGDGNLWNRSEFTDYSDYTVITVYNSLDGWTSLTHIRLRVRGAENVSFEILDFAITGDGVHGFETPEVPGGSEGGEDSGDNGSTETPDTGDVLFTVISGATAEGNVFTNTAYRVNIEAAVDVPVNGNAFFSLKYKASDVIQNFDMYMTAEDASGNSSEYHLASNVPAAGNWTQESFTDYGDFKVITINSKNVSALSSLVKITKVRLYFRLPSEVTGEVIEILDLAITADGEHGFTLPMKIGDFYTNHTNYFTIVKNANNESVVTYTGIPGWHTVNLDVTDIDAKYDIAEIKFTLEKATAICFSYNGKYDTVLDHFLYEAGTHTYTVNLSDYPQGKDLNVLIYFDAKRKDLTEEDVNSVVLNSFKLKSSATPTLEFSVADKTTDYTGSAVTLEVSCAETVEFKYEYQLVGSTEWVAGTPVNAGSYVVRVSYVGDAFEALPVTANVVINKVAGSTVEGSVTADAQTRVVTVLEGYEASLSEDFAAGDEVYDGDEIAYGQTVYYRLAETENYLAGEVLSFTLVRPHVHTYAEEWSKDETHHWHAATCSHNDEVSEKAEHVWGEGVVTTEPTHTEKGEKTFTCVCGATKTEEVAASGHSHSTEWNHSMYEHWHECSCGDKKDVAEHDWQVKSEILPTHTEKGSKILECVCGAKTNESIDALGHEHSTEWSKNDTEHWHECSCGDKADKANHSYDDGVVTKEATTSEEGVKTYTCSCGHTYTEAVAKLAPATSEGCGGSIVATSIAVIGLFGVALFLRKKREE